MKKQIINMIQVLFGTFVLAISVAFFILPFDILSGGVAGIAVAMEPFFHIDKTMFASVLEVALLVVGWIILGKKFAMGSALSSLAYPVFVIWLSKYEVVLEIDPLLASFYSGLLGGIGIGIVMRAGSSTGGMDIPPLVINKITGAKIATLVMVTDAITVLLGIIGYDISAALIGLISVFSSAFAIDKVLSYGTGMNAKSVQIISDSWQEIKAEIYKEINRGVTILDGYGGYQHDPKKVLLCVVSQREYARLLEVIKQVDETAFVITTDATDMYGEGFTYTSPNI